MQCELCGRYCDCVQAIVEGTMLWVCNDCSSYGEVIEIKKPMMEELKKKPVFNIKEKDILGDLVVRNSKEIIRKAREKKGLTQSQLGFAIAEKESLIHSLENGSITPPLKVIKKLEQFLGVKLMGNAVNNDKIEVKGNVIQETKEEKSILNFKSPNLTIGDLVEIKKSRREKRGTQENTE